MNPKTYSASDVASLFGVSESYVSKIAARDGAFMGCRVIRLGRRVLFSRAAIDAALAEYEARVA
jgi:hypothetical protein